MSEDVEERKRLGDKFEEVIQLCLPPVKKIDLLKRLAHMTLHGGEIPGSNLLETSWILLPHGTIVMRKWGCYLAVCIS